MVIVSQGIPKRSDRSGSKNDEFRHACTLFDRSHQGGAQQAAPLIL
jgi:hypothetical protein